MAKLGFLLVLVGMGMLTVSQVESRAAQFKLELYYESLCPFCSRFITEQLYPLLTLFGVENDYLEVEFVPYGKGTTGFVDGNFNFTCQHGPPECDGNRVHACALQKYSRKDAAAFVNCSMGAKDYKWPLPDPFISEDTNCIKALGLNQSVMDECLLSWESNVLLAHNGIRTHALVPKMVTIPWIVIDDIWISGDAKIAARTDFKSFMCNKLNNRGVKTDVCK